MDKNSENYSERFSYMSVIETDKEIITEFVSRWNSDYNVKHIVNK
jgi:hypothetical protein